MRILCVADQVDPLIYSPGIKQRFSDVGLVIGCGDLRLSYYDYIISNLNRPFFFVFGNHDLNRLREFRRGNGDLRAPSYPAPTMSACYINGRVRQEKGLLIAGLGGSRWYNGGPNQFTEIQMFFRALGLLPALLVNRLRRGRFLDLLITHAPPYGIGDRSDPCHRGFKTFLWFMKLFRPVCLVHGHIHLDTAETSRRRYGNTLVVNAFKHTVLELEPAGRT